MALKSDYVRLIKELLPPGPAWPRDDTSSTYALLIDEIAGLCASLDGQARLLVEESDPYTASQSFSDWETDWGLPDDCAEAYAQETGVDQTISFRRAMLVFKASLQHGQNRDFFVEVANLFGRQITIEELRDEEHPALNHTWRVNVRDTSTVADDGLLLNIGRITEETEDDGTLDMIGTATEETLDMGPISVSANFQMDLATVQMEADDPLAYWGDQLIECIIRRYRPAHTTVLFAYQ